MLEADFATYRKKYHRIHFPSYTRLSKRLSELRNPRFQGGFTWLTCVFPRTNRHVAWMSVTGGL